MSFKELWGYFVANLNVLWGKYMFAVYGFVAGFIVGKLL